MNVLVAMLAGLLGAAAGFLLGMGIGSALVRVLHISSREGASGYFAVAIGILTGAAGLLGAIFFTLHWRGAAGLENVLGQGALAAAGIVAVAAAGLKLYKVSRPRFLPPPSPDLHFEIQLPAGVAPGEDLNRFELELQTNLNRMPSNWTDPQPAPEAGRRTLTGFVQLYFRTGQRTLVLSMPDQERRLFKLRLPSDPTGPKHREWSEWRNADFVARLNGPVQPSNEDYRIRYRVESYATQ